jgi:hypothetical protein
VWQNKHLKGGGKKFKCKDKNDQKPKIDELFLGDALDVWGRDEIAIGEIGTTKVADLEPGLTLAPGHFLVRLRFDGVEANAMEAWFNATTATPANVRMVRNGNTVVLAFLVKAIERRDWPVKVENMPWEIRYDW